MAKRAVLPHPIFDYLPNFDPYARLDGEPRAAGRLFQRGGATFVEYAGAVHDFVASGMVLACEIPGERGCARRETNEVRRNDCRLQILPRRGSSRLRVIARPDLSEEEEFALLGRYHELRHRARQIELAQVAKRDTAFQSFMGAVLAKPKENRHPRMRGWI